MQEGSGQTPDERVDAPELVDSGRQGPVAESQPGSVQVIVQGGRTRIVLSGEIPNPVNPPPGCRFQTRCPLVEQRCREASPPLEEKAPGHWAACWLR